jgi:hypothetical protein
LNTARFYTRYLGVPSRYQWLEEKRRKRAARLAAKHLTPPAGFEFLSIVRRRFPEIAVIAIRGAYSFGNHVPGG